MQYKSIIFDLDGTLIDASEGVSKSIDFVIEKLGLPPLSMKEKGKFNGPPIELSFQKKFSLSDSRAAYAAALFRDIYQNQFLFNAEIYKGILPLLTSLKQKKIPTAIVSNKREAYMVPLVDHLGLSPFFDCIIGSNEKKKATKADLIKLYLKKINITEPSSATYIGDTEDDWISARECEIGFIGVTYGFGFQCKQEALDINVPQIAESAAALHKILIR